MSIKKIYIFKTKKTDILTKKNYNCTMQKTQNQILFTKNRFMEFE